jgi:hypothetical protein
LNYGAELGRLFYSEDRASPDQRAILEREDVLPEWGRQAQSFKEAM